jgi:hypothetical protein
MNNIVMCLFEALKVEPEEMSLVSQWLCKCVFMEPTHVTVITDVHTTEEVLEAVCGVRSTLLRGGGGYEYGDVAVQDGEV